MCVHVLAQRLPVKHKGLVINQLIDHSCIRTVRSPLWTASFNGRLEVVTKLIEAGADISQANKVGMK